MNNQKRIEPVGEYMPGQSDFQKAKKNVLYFESALTLAQSHFINECLSPVPGWVKQENVIDIHQFLVLIPGNKIPFCAGSLAETLDLAGYNLDIIPDDIPARLFAFEFHSKGTVIYFRYALPYESGIPRHAIAGTFACGIKTRGLQQIIRNPNEFKAYSI